MRRSLNALPALMALAVLALSPFASLNAEETFSWKTDEAKHTSDLMYNGKPVLRYMFAFDQSSPEAIHDTYKVFHHVFGPQSGEQITKGAGGKFTHHRGLFVGWNKTKIEGGPQYDFWHCKSGAHLRHIKFLNQEADADHGTMTAEIHWNDPDGAPVIKETRTVTVRKNDAGSITIDWQTKLESQRGTISLNGDRQHAGFQFRASQAVADSNGARFLRPADKPQQREAIQVGDKGDPPPHIDLSWFAETFELGDNRYTVEYFDNPSLPKPALFSERPYGRFGTFFKTTLTADQPLEMSYRVVVTEGDEPSVSSIQERYDAWLKTIK